LHQGKKPKMKNYPIQFVIFILLCSSFYSCKKENKLPIYATTEQIILKDINYGKDIKQKMDIYLPAGRNIETTKLVVMIHGGGWVSGDKSDFGINEETLKTLIQQFPDCALINLNYRLASANSNQFPAAENDIKSAMQYIYKNIKSYQISNQTYILGASAGAHLAALQSLKYNENNYIKGCIAISGVYNLTSAYEQSNSEARSFINLFLGGDPTTIPQTYGAASPVNFINVNSPKFLILHGLEDNLVPVSQASELKNSLEAKNVPLVYFTYSGGHGIPPEHLVEAFSYIKDFIN
jgi:acetyl esterase/lipase